MAGRASRFVGRLFLGALTVLLSVSSFGVGNAGAAPVEPATVTASVEPGDSLTVRKTVRTPRVPPKPDVIFLADTTGSMGPAIADVRAKAASIMSTVLAAQPDARFGVAEYKDFNCTIDPFPYRLDQALTADTSAVQSGINSWTFLAFSGCDVREAQLNALYQLATDPAVGFRTGSTRIIAWFGDASGHDPSNGHTLTEVINALQGAQVRVVAVQVITPLGNGLDATGQSSAITDATKGVLLSAATSTEVANAILAGLTNLPVTVTPTIGTCDPDLKIAFDPATRTVTSGQEASFSEQIGVLPRAKPGSTLQCDVNFLLDGKLASGFTQTITITVAKKEAGPGRMTGGGSVFDSTGARVTHGFELHCDPSQTPNNLEINWDNGKKFQLEKLTSASCTDDPALQPNSPTTGFDTYIGTGTGRYNGRAGASAEWTFTDAGEPGDQDTVQLLIKDAAGKVVLSVSGRLDRGNHQTHQQ